MKLRIDHIIVAIIVTTILILAMYLMNFIFTDSYNKKYDRFESEFDKIELELSDKNYQRVIIISRQILANCESGTNEIRAQSYIGLAKIKLGQVEDASEILRKLIGKYPGIKMVYSELLEFDNKKDNLSQIYNSLLSDYVESSKEAINDPMTLLDIFNAIDKVDWAWLIFIWTGTMVVYERIIRKRKKNENI